MAALGLARRAVPFLIVLGTSVWLWTVAETFSISTNLGRAGPELWPKIVLLLMLGAAVWGVVDALFKRQEVDPENVLIVSASRSAGHEEDARKDLAGEPDNAERRPVFSIAGMAAMLGYVAVIQYLGYALSTFLLLMAIMLLAGYRKPIHATLISLLGTAAFFFVFQRVAYISLPLGEGPFKVLSITLMSLIGVR